MRAESRMPYTRDWIFLGVMSAGYWKDVMEEPPTTNVVPRLSMPRADSGVGPVEGTT